ncbi:SEC-C motif domain containing protein [Cupriavidus necator]|uniref:SEC-C motif domain containing protein n=1 Tax=Cupriavidus necator TaxID=106590 RepID=A0A1K0IIW9_CUPNE|nr:SEC-C motif domain containing protein [Cupriavidus necator]
MNTSYSYPVSQLLTLGQFFEEVDGRPATWKGYAKLGVDNRHIPELIAVVADEALHTGYGPVPFAPVHAWRILGALKATEALPALVSLLRRIDDDFDDWIATELPCVFSQMGGQSVDVLAPFAADGHNGSYARGGACRAMGEVASGHPEQRGRCLQILMTLLRSFEDNEQTLNTEIVSVLLVLSAAESIDLIREAYAKDCVDLDCVGDLEDVEIALGLRTERATAPKRGEFFQRLLELSNHQEATRPHTAGPKTGRNDPCPCGSGKKYKKCCLEV